MKILIYGAGVIGCTYGWQLAQAGCDITIKVREEETVQIQQKGISIDCIDFRNNQRKEQNITFKPHVIENLSFDNDYEYIIVTTNSLYLKSILVDLKENAGNAHILFFQNMWDDFELIDSFLLPHQYFFGFPFMAGGGGSRSKGIGSIISGVKQSCTLLGEIDGSVTSRLTKLAEMIEKADLKPVISPQIKEWLITHYVVAAGLLVGVMLSGSGLAFAQDRKMLKQTFKTIREGLDMCRVRDINSRSEKANRLYYLPLWLSVPLASKVFQKESLYRMFDGHTRHAPDEMMKMLQDILVCGKSHGIDMPYTDEFMKQLSAKI